MVSALGLRASPACLSLELRILISRNSLLGKKTSFVRKRKLRAWEPCRTESKAGYLSNILIQSSQKEEEGNSDFGAGHRGGGAMPLPFLGGPDMATKRITMRRPRLSSQRLVICIKIYVLRTAKSADREKKNKKNFI